ncbi:DNA polymerase zeta catalytic [Apiospora saccharicola]
MESPESTRVDAESHVTNFQVINARPKQECPLLALSEKIESYRQCDPDALDAAGFAFVSSMILGTYERDDKDNRLDIPVTYGFPFLSRVIGTGPSSMNEDRIPGINKLAPRSDCAPETPSASFSSVYRTAKAAVLDAGQTTVMEVTLYESDSLERPNPNNEANCAEDDNEGEEEVKEEGDNRCHPRKHPTLFTHLLNIGIGPEGAIIWSGDLSKARLRSWDEAEEYAAGFD